MLSCESRDAIRTPKQAKRRPIEQDKKYHPGNRSRPTSTGCTTTPPPEPFSSPSPPAPPQTMTQLLLQHPKHPFHTIPLSTIFLPGLLRLLPQRVSRSPRRWGLSESESKGLLRLPPQQTWRSHTPCHFRPDRRLDNELSVVSDTVAPARSLSPLSPPDSPTPSPAASGPFFV